MNIGVVFSELAAFFDDQFISIIVATLGLFTIVLVTWWIYRTLSQRNIFNLFTKERPHPGFKDITLYGLKFFFLFPLLVFIGFLIFAFSLFILMKPTVEQQAQILFMAIVLVSTIRVGAYVHQSLAEDLAKLIPLSMLAVLLMNPSLSSIGVTLDQAYGFVLLLPGFLKYLIFTITLEVLLRGGTWLFFNLNREDPSPTQQ